MTVASRREKGEKRMENVDESAAAKRRTGGADPLRQAPRQGEGGDGGPGESNGGEEDPSDKPQEPIAPDERGD
jgi:hypothetical protein